MKLVTDKPEKIIRTAVEKYRDWIAPTYGPAGKKILIVQNEFNHEAVDDGKRATQAFEREDEFENAVVQYIKSVNEKCKDGNTTAGLIMAEIVLEAFRGLDDPTASKDYHGMVLNLRKGIVEAVKAISKSAKKIETKEQLYLIAYNSYKNEKIAKLIADTVYEIGKDGKLDVGDSPTAETTVEKVNGLEIPKGFASPYLFDELENPAILLINGKVNLFTDLVPAICRPPDGQGRRPFIASDLVIIAESFSDEVVGRFLAYKMAGGIRPLLIETPGYGDKQENLEDIAAIIGATVVDGKLLTLDKVTKEHFGSCEIIKATKDKTKILGGKGNPKRQIDVLKKELEKSTNNFEKDKLKQRIAVLAGGIAVIKVGAYTTDELKTTKAKVENAVNSTQMAFKGGGVKGGGKAFLGIKTSSDLLNTALQAPRRQLEENGKQYLDENSVDPLEVVITSLEGAYSIASGLLELGGISVPKRKKEDQEY